MEPVIVHGLEWTTKELFVYPNEFIYWSIQIVMYPYMTGRLVAGAFVLSSLYHVFGQKDLKELARFSLVFSLAPLPTALMPLLFHLQQPLRGINVMLTPHFTFGHRRLRYCLFHLRSHRSERDLICVPGIFRRPDRGPARPTRCRPCRDAAFVPCPHAGRP